MRIELLVLRGLSHGWVRAVLPVPGLASLGAHMALFEPSSHRRSPHVGKEVAVATLGPQGECWKPWPVGWGEGGEEKGCILHLEPSSSP